MKIAFQASEQGRRESLFSYRLVLGRAPSHRSLEHSAAISTRPAHKPAHPPLSCLLHRLTSHSLVEASALCMCEISLLHCQHERKLSSVLWIKQCPAQRSN